MGASLTPLAIAGASGALDLLSTHMTNEANKSNVTQTNDTNKEIAERNLQAQKEENSVNREYYSPVEMVKRFQEAGLNPSVMFGQGTNVATSNSSSGLTPVMPNITPFNRIAPQIGSDVISAIQSLSEAKRNTSESSKIDKTLQAYLDTLKESAEGQRISNSVQRTYGSLLAESKVSESVHHALLLYKQAETAASESDLNKVKEVSEQAKQELDRATARLHGEQARNMQLANETFMREFEARMKELQSRTNLQGAQADTEYALRSERLNVLRADSRMQNASAAAQELVNTLNESLDKDGYLINAKRSELMSIVNEEHLKKMSVQEQEAVIDFLIKQEEVAANMHDWSSRFFWADLLKSFASAGGSAAGAYIGARYGKR